MKTIAYTAIGIFIVIFFVSCKSATLEEENKKLKEQVQQLNAELEKLKDELEDLKQTDTYLYSKSMEYIKESDKDVDAQKQREFLLKAKELFDKLFNRYPASQYVSIAKNSAKAVNDTIALIGKINKAEDDINASISDHNFDKAWVILKSIKPHIAEDYYKQIAKRIDEEKNKPIELSVLDLISDKEKYAAKKVKIKGYMCQNWASFSPPQFNLLDNSSCLGTTAKLTVRYGSLPAQEKKRMMVLNPKGGDTLAVTVVGIFNGDEMNAIEVE